MPADQQAVQQQQQQQQQQQTLSVIKHGLST